MQITQNGITPLTGITDNLSSSSTAIVAYGDLGEATIDLVFIDADGQPRAFYEGTLIDGSQGILQHGHNIRPYVRVMGYSSSTVFYVQGSPL